MKWTKIVLLFQAIVTLIIGGVFFSQLIVIDKADIDSLKVEITNEENSAENLPPTLVNIKQRYTVAAYLLSIISIIEILIISRFFH